MGGNIQPPFVVWAIFSRVYIYISTDIENMRSFFQKILGIYCCIIGLISCGIGNIQQQYPNIEL